MSVIILKKIQQRGFQLCKPLVGYKGAYSVKNIYVIEQLCNGCRLCETFCSSLTQGVFSSQSERIQVIKMPGEEKDIPIVHCNGKCIRSIFDDGRPTCVGLCPTGAIFFADHQEAINARREYEAARKEHSIFKFIAPWKWPFPWRRSGEKKARSPMKELA